ncbi:MAG TPA: PIN domain-containing protein [Ginsengibacter sp.]
MTNGTIIDSSVWIDYFNNVISDQTNAADNLLENRAVVILPVILQEILQGIRKREIFDSIKWLMLSLEFFQYKEIQTAIDAASLYRFLKTKGVTIRKPNDCLIAAICINNSIPLLHKDKDFDNIAKHTSLKIYKIKNDKN